MKKTHLILLVITAIMTLFSAYSLAAINQVYKIDYEWYSQYSGKYTNEYRDTLKDRWMLADMPPFFQLDIIGKYADLDDAQTEHLVNAEDIPQIDLNRYIYLYCSLGRVSSPEYRVKIVDIAQRVNVVEVKLSINSPARLADKPVSPDKLYTPVDVVRIDRFMFSTKGKLYFVFKSQDGRQLYETSYEVK